MRQVGVCCSTEPDSRSEIKAVRESYRKVILSAYVSQTKRQLSQNLSEFFLDVPYEGLIPAKLRIPAAHKVVNDSLKKAFNGAVELLRHQRSISIRCFVCIVEF